MNVKQPKDAVALVYAKFDERTGGNGAFVLLSLGVILLLPIVGNIMGRLHSNALARTMERIDTIQKESLEEHTKIKAEFDSVVKSIRELREENEDQKDIISSLRIKLQTKLMSDYCDRSEAYLNYVDSEGEDSVYSCKRDGVTIKLAKVRWVGSEMLILDETPE
jgi:hypothetical protein